MNEFLNKSLHRMRSAFEALPSDCLFCGVPCAHGLCSGCCAELPRLPSPACPVCAEPVPVAGVCGRCLAAAPAFTRTYACYRYDGWLAAAIQAAKFGQRWSIFPVLAQAMLCEMAAVDVNLIVPVPLAATRLAERGYNQSVEIAAVLAKGWRRPLLTDLLLRTRDGEHQARLRRSARLRNLRASFETARLLHGEHVLLVDDVMTSGATLQACAKTLLRAGAGRIDCCVLARTL